MTPPICPRCGSTTFREPQNYGEVAEIIPPSARRVDIPFSRQAEIDVCTECGLSWTPLNPDDDGGWRTPEGGQWFMGESGE